MARRSAFLSILDAIPGPIRLGSSWGHRTWQAACDGPTTLILMTDPDYSEDEQFERLIEEYLGRLADGEALVISDWLSRIPDSGRCQSFLVTVLAEEYMLRVARGAKVVLADFLQRVDGESGREDLRQYIRDSRRAGRFLPRSLAVGAIIARKYQILRELGRGGMAVVYAAQDLELDREVAMKVYNHLDAPAEDATSWEEAVASESRLLASLRSRNIVVAHDVLHEGEHSFLVMDRVEGCDLGQVIESLRGLESGSGAQAGPTNRVAALRSLVGGTPEGEYGDMMCSGDWSVTVASIIGRAAHALELAHDAGVLHRDLKPSNFVLVSGGEPVLLDFGLAAAVHGGPKPADEGFHGTIEYVAPEQARSFSTGRDARTDVYQLGLVLYEILGLRRAFIWPDDESLEDFLGRKREGYIEPFSSRAVTIPAAMRAICDRALAPDLEARYASIGEMRSDLARHAAGLPPQYARIGLGPATWLRARHIARRPAAMVALILGVPLLVVFLVRESAWVPPVLQPFQLQAGATNAELLSPGDSIEFRDGFVLGLQVSAREPTVLYAFSVFGEEADGSRYLVPVSPEHYGQAEPWAGPPRPLEVPPGQTMVSCSFVTETSHPSEGILVYACPDENQVLARWQEQLYLRAKAEEGYLTWTYDDAFAFGGQLLEGGAKGDTGASITAEQRELLFGNARDMEIKPMDEWRELGFLRKEFAFSVSRADGSDR